MRVWKLWIFLGSIVFLSWQVRAAAIQSADDGDWSNGATWVGGVVPTSADSVTIVSTATVTVDNGDAISSTVTIHGRLKFSRVAHSTLTVVGGDVDVQAGGWLDMGSGSDSILTSSATLILSSGTYAGQYGLIVRAGGNFTVWGSTKTPATNASANAIAGATTISLSASPASMGWSIGDSVTLGQTERSSTDQTERRTITGISGNDITVAALTYSHFSTATFRVANLTRNVLVRSSGTTVAAAGGNSAYIRNLATHATGFTLTYGEFAYLGSSTGDRDGIVTAPSGSIARATISSCTVRDGYHGLANNYGDSTNHIYRNNIIYKNTNVGIYMASPQNLILNNDIASNGNEGFACVASGQELLFANNFIYSNNSVRSYVAVLLNNVISAQRDYNLWDVGSSLYVSNRITRAAVGGGMVCLYNDFQSVAINNYSYDNSPSSLGHLDGGFKGWYGGALGYDPSGNSLPSASTELSGTSPIRTRLFSTRINGAIDKVTETSISSEGSYFMSYNQDFDTGTIRLWGDYSVSASTFSLEYASPLYTSSATRVYLLRNVGGNHSLTVNSTNDTNAINQLITAEYVGGQWTVYGSSSVGTLCTPTSGVPTNCPASNTQFNLTITNNGTPAEGDMLAFGLTAASGDTNVRKKFYMGPVASGLNRGRSKLTIAPSGVFVTSGTLSNPSLMTMLDTGGTFYTFVSSGQFHAYYSSFTYMSESGIQLNGSGPFSVNYSTFDYLGSGASSTGTLFTLNGVTQSTITLVGNTYGNNSIGTLSNKYNYTISGSSVGLYWNNQVYTGTQTGDSKERSDPGNKINWAPAGCATFTSLVGAQSWSSGASWDSGIAPSACNAVVIPVGSTMTVDTGNAVASTTTVYGTLKFSRVVSSTFTLVLGSMTVISGGSLDMGSPGDPISVSSATLVLAYGSTAGKYGLEINNGANFSSYGSARTPYTTATAGAGVGANQITVNDTGLLGWSVGDSITVDTETVTITALSGSNPMTITFSPVLGAAHPHASTAPVRVGMLSRNVVVRSSGTATANKAYLRNLTTFTTSFSAVNTEFAYLGATGSPKWGITFDGAAVKGNISSCTIRSGFNGIYLNASSNITISDSLIYASADRGIYAISSPSSCTLRGNMVYANTLFGINLDTASRFQLVNNYFFRNTNNGLQVQSTSNNNVIRGNTSHHNTSNGIALTNSSYNQVESNYCYSNNSSSDKAGIFLDTSSSNTITGNTLRGNSYGVQLYQNNTYNLITGNTIEGNTNVGMAAINGSSQNTFFNQFSATNTANGFELGGGNNVCVNCQIGYNASGASAASGSSEILFQSGGGVTMYGSRVNSNGVNTTNMGVNSAYFASYNQNYSTGSVLVYGNYVLSGSTMTLDYSTYTYRARATAPSLKYYGSGAHTAVVNSVSDTNAVTQLITATYTGGQWVVTGSSTPGTLCTPVSATPTDCPASGTQFTLTITNNGSPVEGDVLDFALLAAGLDHNVTKQLFFGPSASSFNRGRSKLTVAPGAGFSAQGSAGNFSLITMLGGSTYYTFVDSGAFTVSYASFTYMDESGIQLNGSGPFSINYSTFDYVGAGVVSTGTLFTLNGVTQSTITLTSVAYGNNGDAGLTSKYNYTISGSSTGLYWTNNSALGALVDDAHERNDTANKINWGTASTDRYWVSAIAGNWNNTANWSTTSGGAGGASVPGPTDHVTFDANGLGDVAIDASVNVSTLTISTSTTGGYTGSVDTSSNSIVVSSFTLNRGTFFARTSTMTIAEALSVNGGTFNAGASSITVQGNFTKLSGATFTAGTSRLILAGTGKTATVTVLTLNDYEISGSVTQSGALNVNSLFILTGQLSGGGFVAMVNGSTATITGTFSSGGGLTINDTAVLSTGGTLNANVTFNATNADASMPARIYGGSVRCGNFSAPRRVIPLSGTHTIGNSLTMLNSGAAINTFDASVHNPTISISSGISLTSTSGFPPVIKMGSGQWNIGGPGSLSTGTINAGSANVTFSTNVILSGATFNADTSSISVTGDWTLTTSSFTAGSSTVTFTGAAGSTSTLTGSTTFYNFFVNTSSKNLVFQANSTTTVTNQLLLSGSSGNLVRVLSDTPGSYAYLINSGTNTVTFVEAQDSEASGGKTIRAGSNSTGSHTVNWTFGEPAPTAPTITNVYLTSMTVTWGNVSPMSGYVLEAGTASFAAPGTIISSATTNTSATTLGFNAGQLVENTTYYVRVGALYNGATSYADAAPSSTSTLTSLLSPTLYGVNYTSVTVNWPAFGAGPGASTAEGYRLEASTSSDFTPVHDSSVTANVALSTLTLVNLSGGSTYYLRVGALNWNNVAHYSGLGSTVTYAVGCSTLTSLSGARSWSTAADWDLGGVPTSCNPVLIPVGSTMTIDTGSAVASTTTVNGTLKFSRVVSSTLTLVGGDITVNAGGTLDMGTAGSPITVSSATLVLAFGDPNYTPQYALKINNGGNFSVNGTARTPWVYAEGDALSGQTSIAVTTSGLNWSVGDLVAIDTETVTLVAPINAGSINFSPALTLSHFSTTPVIIANMTSNVVVRSSAIFSSPEENASIAKITNFAQNATSFVLVNGVLDSLYDLEFAASSRGNISSSTFLNSSLYLQSASTVTASNIYGRQISLGGSGHNLQNNVIANVSGYALFMNASANIVQGNQFISNLEAVYVNGNGNSVRNNLIVSNNFCGVDLRSGVSNNAVTQNTMKANGVGICALTTANSNTISSNTIALSIGHGMQISGASNNIVGNEILSNAGSGILFASGNNNTLSNNFIWNNSAYGVLVASATGNILTGGAIGYSTMSVASSNGLAEIYIDSTTTSASNLTLRGTRINPTMGISTVSFNRASKYVISYNQDFDTGTVRVWGDYTVSASTFVVAYSSNLYTGSGDINVRKKLLFGPSASEFNNGRSQISIASSGVFIASGTASNPTLIDWVNSGSTYYTFVSSGQFKVYNASFTNMDHNGIWLNGSGPYEISYSTFDYNGVTSSTATLFTLNGVTQSTITLVGVTYGNSRPATRNYNYTISGSSTGLYWNNQQYTGALAGDANERSDTSNKINWASVGCSTFTSVATGNWGTGSTWDSGIVPTSCNPVYVAYGTTVTVNGDYQASTTTIAGQLSFSRVVSSTLTLVGGSITVSTGGYVDMGNSADPITTSSATLILAYGNPSGSSPQYRMTVQDGGNFTMFGVTRKRWVSASENAMVGQSSIAVTTSGLGWNIGDLIAIDTETVTLTAPIDAGGLNFTPALTLNHYSTTSITIANLTSNVVIRSSGTNVAQPNALGLISNLVRNTTSFDVANGKLDSLYELRFESNALGSVSSSTIINGGNTGLYFTSASSNSVIANAVYFNKTGLESAAGAGLLIYSNAIAKSTTYGASLLGSGNFSIQDNTAFQNFIAGWFIGGTGNTIIRNAAHSNDNTGLALFLSSGAIVSSNTVHSNLGYGIDFVLSVSYTQASANLVFANGLAGIRGSGGGAGNVISNSTIYSNARGVDLNTGNYTVRDCRIYSNVSNGLSISGSGHTLSDNSIYSNGGAGIRYGGAVNTSGQRNYVWGNSQYGLSSYAGTGLSYSDGAVGYSSTSVPSPNGVAEVYIDSSTTAGNLTLYATRINPSVGISTYSFNQADSYVLSYNQDFDTGTVRVWGDYTVSASTFALEYASELYSGSGDTNVRKKLLFGRGNTLFNSGRSRLRVSSSGVFVASGTASNPTLIDWVNSGSTYYTFVSSGQFKVYNASFTNMDHNGIWLNGTGPYEISYSTFDYNGVTSSTATLFTLNGVTQSTITLVGVTYGNSRPTTRNYNYTIAGSSTGLRWVQQQFAGALAGDANERNDTANRIVWASTMPPVNPLITGVFITSMSVTYGTVLGSEGYSLEASTASNFTGPVTSSVTVQAFMTNLSFNADDLAPNTTYYLRVGNIAGGSTTYAATTPASTSTLASFITGAQVYAVMQTSITVNWLPFSAGSGADTSEGYRVEASSSSNFIGTLYSSATATVTSSTLTVIGLTSNVQYYFRAGALNHNQVASFVTPTGSPATTIAGPAPQNFQITNVYISSLTATWNAMTSDTGYVLEASTASFAAPGTIISSITTNTPLTTLSFNLGDLSSNTTYYIRVGALYNGATSYAIPERSTSTLTQLITGAQVYSVGVTTITANWLPLGAGGAVGYRLEAYSDSGYTTLAGSSVTLNGVSPSTLTITGLSAHATYYLRVGGINHNSVVNYATFGSTRTDAGAAPGNPTISNVYITSMTVTWSGVSNHGGYVIEADDNSDFLSITASSITTQTSLTSLSFNAGSLSPNTTYYVRVGALYNGATTYSTTTPASTSTLTSLVSGAQVYSVGVTTITANWLPLANTVGYRLEAYSDAGYTTLAGSSVTLNGVDPSTLTITGLSAYTTYYLRVGGINHNSVVNYVTFGSTRTDAGAAPGNPTIPSVYMTSMTVTWTGVSNHGGYVIEADNDSDFTSVTASSITTQTSLTTLTFNSGTLSPNTTYYIRVGALYNGATVYANTIPASTATLTSLLVNTQIYALYTTSITGNWTAFGSGSGAATAIGYRLEASSTTFDGTGTIYSSTTYNTALSTLTVEGLTVDVAYTLRVGALNHQFRPNYVAMGTSTTVSGAAPGNPTITNVYSSSMTVGWTDVNDNTGYVIQASTWSGFTGAIHASSVTADTNAVALTFNAGDLDPNTTYYVRAGALYGSATSYALTQPASTSTLTSLISNAQVYSVGVTTITANWLPLGSAVGYRLEAYSDAGYTALVGSSVTLNGVNPSTLTITGLSVYTTYYLRVGGINHNSVVNYVTFGSTRTDAGAAPGNPTISSVFITSMTVNWTGVSNHGGYILEADNDSDFGSITASSITTQTSLTSLSFNAGSLAPNTTYYVRVGALYNGATTYSTPTPASTSTLTSLISNAQVYSVGVTTITANWLALGSAVGYRLEAYSDAGYTSLAGSSVTLNGVDPSTLTITGLSAYTTYYLRVGGINHNSVVNYVTFGSTRTDAGAAPGNPTITNVSLTSMSVTWGDVADNGGYVLEADDNNDFSSITASSVTVNANGTGLSFNASSLAPNTTYYVRVGALYNGTTVYADTVPSSTSTLASFLTGAQVYQIAQTSITVNWQAFSSGSGADTSEGYRVEASSSANFIGTLYSSATATVTSSTLTVIGLTSNVQYYFRAGALNHNQVPSYVTPTGSPATTVAGPAPQNFQITNVYISSLTATWNSMTSDTGYVLEASTASDFTGVIVSSLTPQTSLTTLTFNAGDLASNTTYFVRLGALYSGATSYATPNLSTSTLTSLISNAQVYSVGVTTITANWLPLGAGGAVGYRLEAYSDASYTTLVQSSVTLNGVDPSTLTITGLSAHTTYYLRVGGINHNSVVNYVTFGSTRTDAGAAPGNPTISSVFITSMTVNWTGVSNHGGYVIEADDNNDFSSVTASSSTTQTSLTSLSFNAGSLSPNTTYYVRVGALYNGATTYSTTTPASTSTLTSLISGAQVYSVGVTTITANWLPLANAVGYRLEAYSDSSYTTLAGSSVTLNGVDLSTLTITGLSAHTTYYLRVGGINHNSVVNYVTFGSTRTDAGAAPGNPTITSVYMTSMTVTWSGVSNHGGYVIEADNDSDFTSVTASSITTQTSLTTLTFNSGTLSPNTTYYIRVGALYNGATSYSTPTPASTSTLTSYLSGAQVYQVNSTSVTVNWLPFSAGSGVDSAVGYRVDASSTDFNGTGTIYSSATYNVALSTLTVPSLGINVQYYFRVGALNHNDVPNWVTPANSPATTIAGPAPTGFQITNVYVSSLTAVWNSMTSDSGYVLEASTASNFSGIIISSLTAQTSLTTLTFNAGNLSPNTTYFVRVGSLWSSATSYAIQTLSTSTLTSLLTGTTVSAVGLTSISGTWAGFASGSGANTAVGYWMQVSTSATFVPVAGSSRTYDVNISTLTVGSLTPLTTYYFRVGALNHNNVPNFVVYNGSTMTLRTPAPTGLAGTALGVSSITWAWGAVSGASDYRIYQATSPTTLIAATGGPNSYVETGLSTNTAYGRVVTAIYGGVESDLSASATTYTKAAIPGTPAFSGVAYTSFTVTWSANQNPSGTRFEISRSLDNFVTNFSTPIAFADNFTGTTTDFVNLSPSTTYYIRIRAINGDDVHMTAFSTVASTVTLTVPIPTNLAGTALGVSSISWTWNTIGSATEYRVYQSTSPTTLVISTPIAGYSETGLSTNTAYGRVVSAVINGVESAVSGAVTVYTHAATPGTPAFSNVAFTSFTVTWPANSNPGTTPYLVSLSSDNFVTHFSTPVPFASNLTAATTTLATLLPGTTYYVRVQARNGDSIVSIFSVIQSTVTLATPKPVNLVGVAVGVSSISWTWSQIPAATEYRVYQATSPTTLLASRSTPDWTETGLSTNTAYGRVVSALIAGVEGALSDASTTYTRASIPGTPVFSGVAYTSFTVTWAANQNPAGTRYEVTRSTDNFSTHFSTPITFADSFTGTTTDFVNLVPGSTYYLRIRAENGDDLMTAFSATASTRTLSVPTPTGFTGSVLGTSSITWSWGNADAAATYRVYQATSPTTLVGTSATTSFDETGLSTNTAYGRGVKAVIGGVESGLSDTATFYTFAAIPGQPSFTSVLSTRFTVSWDASGNPGTTPYEVSASSDPAFAVAVSTPFSFGANFTATTTNFVNLEADTTYYVRVRARNGDGVITAFSVVGSTKTSPTSLEPPLGVSGVALGVSSIAWSWSSVSGATSYRIYQSTSPTTLVGTSATTTFNEVGLSTNTAYARVVSAVAGVSESLLSDAATTYTWAAVPTSTSWLSVNLTSATAQWNVNENPAGTNFQAQISQQANFAASTSSTTVLSLATFQSLSSNATYYVRVRAENGDAIPTAYDTIITTITPAAVPNSGAFGTVTDTQVAISWGIATNIAGSTYQAELSSISAVGIATQTVVTTSLSNTFTGLVPDTTYYARVKTIGRNGTDSAYLVIGSTITLLTPPTQVRYSSATASLLTLDWQATTAPNIEFVAELAEGSPFSVPTTSTTVILQSTFTSLNINTLYYGRVRIHNLTSGNLSVWSTVVSTYTLAVAPINLSTTAVANTSISLLWDSNSNPSGTLYGVERSTSGLSWTQVGTTNNVNYTDIGLTPGTPYQYRVRAFNGNLVPTGYTSVITVMTTGSLSNPKKPTGFWAERTDVGGGNVQVSFHWRRVTLRDDGSTLLNLDGYQIFSSTSLFTPKASWTLVTTHPTEDWSLTQSADTVLYYCVRTIDLSGAYSDWTEMIDTSADLNHVWLAEDGISRATLPQTAASLLRRDRNSYGSDLRMEWQMRESEETGRVVRSLWLKTLNEDTDSEAPIVFDPPVLRGVIAYTVVNGNVVAGSPRLSSSAAFPVITAQNASTQLSLFWYNGREWVKTSGVVNTADNTMSFTGGRAGAFQIRAATRSPGVTITRVYPRIISPNGDGWNDKVIFQFDNPQLAPLAGKIYDITGAYVADLVAGPNPDSTLSWNGKDSGGTVVPGGIYVYQVDGGSGVMTGSVVVAR